MKYRMKTQNKYYIIFILTAIVLGLATFIIGLALEGWNVEEWFRSRFFWFFIAAIVIWLLVFLYVFISSKVKGK